MIDVFSMLLHLHSTIKKLKINQKEYQILSHLLIYIIGRVWNINCHNKTNFTLFEKNNPEIV